MKKLSKLYLAIVFIFLYSPIVVMILISFNAGESTAHMTGLSLRWYRQMLSDDITLNAFRNTLVLSSVSALVSTLLGTLASVGISRIRKRRIRNADRHWDSAVASATPATSRSNATTNITFRATFTTPAVIR